MSSTNIPTTEKLEKVMQSLRDIRDDQEEIECPEHELCVCNDFDQILDRLELLRERFVSSTYPNIKRWLNLECDDCSKTEEQPVQDHPNQLTLFKLVPEESHEDTYECLACNSRAILVTFPKHE